ncbi:Gfo/Idh/MocA family protein [Acidimangrovimonas pyrenivorans]|uniref:Gfo/Idh/MocA family protein n=1 Tax=Acidimangrovimonas pyrenivorans TaxID=2030798 RepID=A0ABV7AG16_9RHOB
MDMVNWGILSAAKIAREWVAPAIHNSERGRIAAIASRTPGKAEALAAPYGDVWCHSDYDALLEDPNIDAVYIPLPNAAHVTWTERALKAGKHVLCEKPIALEADQIDHLIRVRDQTGLLAAEAFMVTHHPQWHRVRSLIAEGAIGRLTHVQGGFSFFNDDPQNIRNDAAQGGGALRDIGVYPSVTARFVTGEEPDNVTARIDWEHGIDASARVWAEFPSFTMDFFVSMRRHPWQQMLFHGTAGWIRVNAPFNAGAYADEVIEIADRTGARRIERHAAVDQYTAQIDAFNATVLDGDAFGCPLEFSRGNQRMIDMIYAAGT